MTADYLSRGILETTPSNLTIVGQNSLELRSVVGLVHNDSMATLEAKLVELEAVISTLQARIAELEKK
jgi:hypothetical protein